MGSTQSAESGYGRPRITETANFDFRDEPVTRWRGGWGELSAMDKEQETNTSKSQGWLENRSSIDRFGGWKNGDNIHGRS